MLPPTLGVSESLPSVAFDLNGLNTDGSMLHDSVGAKVSEVQVNPVQPISGGKVRNLAGVSSLIIDGERPHKLSKVNQKLNKHKLFQISG